MTAAKWFHVIGVGYVFCTGAGLRKALPGVWTIEETEHSGVARRIA